MNVTNAASDNKTTEDLDNEMIVLEVNHQTMQRIDDFKIVADSKNYLKAKFIMTEEWTGDIIATFGFGKNYYNQLVLDSECQVPWEVIKAPYFTVSLACDNLVTSNVVGIKVRKSGLTNGEIPQTPTPTVFHQYLEEVRQLIKDSQIEQGAFSAIGDEFCVNEDNALCLSPEIMDKINEAQSKLITQLSLGGSITEIENQTLSIPVASSNGLGIVKSSTTKNGIEVKEDGSMSVNSIDISKITQDEGDKIIFNCGNAEN